MHVISLANFVINPCNATRANERVSENQYVV